MIGADPSCQGELQALGLLQAVFGEIRGPEWGCDADVRRRQQLVQLCMTTCSYSQSVSVRQHPLTSHIIQPTQAVLVSPGVMSASRA